jgi:hypothetical protein
MNSMFRCYEFNKSTLVDDSSIVYCKYDVLNKVINSLTKPSIIVANYSDWGLETLNGKDYICESIHSVRSEISYNLNLKALYGTNISLDFKERPYKIVALPYGINECQEEPIRAAPEHKNKDILCFVNFRTHSNPVRSQIRSYFESKPWALTEVDKSESLTNYVDKLKRSKFVVCPEGAGLDTYRTWEALYAGAIPIVTNSNMNKRFANLLPMLLVDNFTEITEEVLAEKYTNKDVSAAYVKYYQDKLKSDIASFV